ncbi:MAG: type I restriction endonuclease [Candidatus Saganbacteria bacterium]|nr:type I restriction endonuclease [Candidatus Saganbacteria bacterium]
MITNTKELGFEEFIEKHLISSQSYCKLKPGDFDKAICFDKDTVIGFIKKTQSKEWKKLLDQHGEDAENRFFKRLDEEIRARGILEVLRSGINDHGIKFDLAYFKPETKLNEETLQKYNSNIFSVVRQLKYSEKNENSIDMVIFINGLPIFTIELKNQLTGQSVKNGIMQYKTDRDPREKLLSFKRCLTHFAVDTEVVFMTTKLEGLRTRFLPFNKGNNNSAGNPVAEGKYKTHYFWEEVLSPDSILELVGRFVNIQKDEKEDQKGKKYTEETLIFPRYHQLDTVKRLVADSRENGAGKNYLIQHSAGSGKSNTIAWTAHRLSALHNSEDQKVFDSVIVVTDRRVLDRQLRNTIMQFEQTAGVVKPIIEGSKELKEALEAGEKIITTTLQKFPFIVGVVDELPGKKFAVIIDEAHSSQSGESSKGLKIVLKSSGKENEEETLEEAEREDDTSKEETLEDMILKEMRGRRSKSNTISFFAFTATPKQKTLEVFGDKSPVDNKFYPFSLYSMKQAIEEGFILDVLKNYTTYQVYFSLIKKIENDPEYEKKKAQRMLLNYVEKHEHAINKKVSIISDHFAKNISHQINGNAKAMIVTRSRLHAVRFKIAMDKYLKEKGYPFKALVAFSGKVKDGKLEYAEQQMNGGIPEKNTAEEFKKSEYKFLICADKFQTGFDQPLLSVMYVDKKLGGVNAVQTLSRLNRVCPNKDEVFVLDFVNDTDDIKESFQPYYVSTVLSESTDPNLLHDLQRDILNFRLFSEAEIDNFVELLYLGKSPAQLNSFLDVVAERFAHYLPEEQDDMRVKFIDYIRKYAFIAQIITFEDTRLEKLYIFLRNLYKKLPARKNPLPWEILQSIDMESYKVIKDKETRIFLEDEQGLIRPIEGAGRGKSQDELDMLSRIIKDINDKFGTTFSTDDRVILNNLGKKLLDNESLSGSIQNNARDVAKIKFDEIFQQELINMLNQHFDFYKKLDSNIDLKEYVNQKLFDYVSKKVTKNAD